QRTYYYPYGEPWRYPDGQQYLYSDKELTRADGRHAYTFPARTLLPSLPRWTTPDPHSESYYSVSPYSYCAANPIMAIDPSGCDSIFVSKNSEGMWNIDREVITPGNDFIGATFDNYSQFQTYSEGNYGERVIGLNLEIDDYQTLGVVHISGKSGIGSTLFYVTPGGESSNAVGSEKRINDGEYPFATPNQWNKWQKPGLGGQVANRGIRFHYGTSRGWSQGCFILSNSYYLDGGKVKFNLGASQNASAAFDNLLGATEQIEYSSNGKSRQGSVFPAPIPYVFILKSLCNGF
ncbi:MAG: RHS repeat-associated core domain-containing protein, partial [Muribaculaceae bacterium]